MRLMTKTSVFVQLPTQRSATLPLRGSSSRALARRHIVEWSSRNVGSPRRRSLYLTLSITWICRTTTAVGDQWRSADRPIQSGLASKRFNPMLEVS